MIQKQPFGDLFSTNFNKGDLVKWSVWNPDAKCWEFKFGTIIKIKFDLRDNRFVSISEVYVYEQGKIREFFTLSLKKVKND